MKNRFKIILIIVITAILFGSIGVYAGAQILAKDISFTSKNEKFTATNVEEALDELYSNKNSNNIKLNFYLDDIKQTESIDDQLLYKLECDNDSLEYLNEKIYIKSVLKDGDNCSIYYVSINKILTDDEIRKNVLSSSEYINYLNKNAITVPTLTNNDKVISGGSFSSDYEGFKAFDNDDSTRFASPCNGIPNYIGYEFDDELSIYKITWKNASLGENIKTYKIQYFDNTSNEWKDATEVLTSNDTNNAKTNTILLEKTYISTKWRLYIISSTSSSYVNLVTLQFYGIK